MKRFFLHPAIMVITFVIGVFMAGLGLNGLLKSGTEVEQPVINVQLPQLTFDCSNHSRGSYQKESVNGALRGSCKGSDGSKVYDAVYPLTYTEQEAYRTFEGILTSASNIISITPILDDQGNEIGKRALIQNKESVKILKVLKVDERKFFIPYLVFEIEAQDFPHLLAFEQQEPRPVRR